MAVPKMEVFLKAIGFTELEEPFVATPIVYTCSHPDCARPVLGSRMIWTVVEAGRDENGQVLTRIECTEHATAEELKLALCAETQRTPVYRELALWWPWQLRRCCSFRGSHRSGWHSLCARSQVLERGRRVGHPCRGHGGNGAHQGRDTRGQAGTSRCRPCTAGAGWLASWREWRPVANTPRLCSLRTLFWATGSWMPRT